MQSFLLYWKYQLKLKVDFYILKIAYLAICGEDTDRGISWSTGVS